MQYLIALLLFGTVTLLVHLVLSPSDTTELIRKRAWELRERGPNAGRLEEEELAEPFTRRILAPLLTRLYRGAMRWTPAGVRQKTRDRLIQAGQPVDTARFLGLKLLMAAVALAATGMLVAAGRGSGGAGRAVLLGLALVALAYFLPEFWLSRKITARKKALERELPDVLDLLCVSVEAGLGFDGAVQKVAEKFAEPTAGEFTAYLKEVRLGKPRADALRNLAQRTGVPEMQSFTAAIIQADQLGVSVSKVLRVQSEHMRVRRKQRAEERAMQTPIKMLFPLVFFIFPTIFIVLLGPVLLHYMKVFGS